MLTAYTHEERRVTCSTPNVSYCDLQDATTPAGQTSLTPRQAQLAREMYAETGPDGKHAHTVADIARELQVGRTTVYRYLDGASA